MDQQFWLMLGWVIAASGLGFATSAIFAGWMQLSRHRFLVPYVLVTGVFLYSFITANQIDVAALLSRQWGWGVLAGVLVSVFLVRNVRTQPASRQTSGAGLAFDLAWAGVVYGLVDALFLNVMPVVAIWVGTSHLAWAATPEGSALVVLLALSASLLVTLAYHLGYAEFRNRSVGLVLLGNTVITLAFLMSGSPWGSILSHTVMHIAAVLRGPETTIQLPPHQQAGFGPGGAR